MQRFGKRGDAPDFLKRMVSAWECGEARETNETAWPCLNQSHIICCEGEKSRPPSYVCLVCCGALGHDDCEQIFYNALFTQPTCLAGAFEEKGALVGILTDMANNLDPKSKKSPFCAASRQLYMQLLQSSGSMVHDWLSAALVRTV